MFTPPNANICSQVFYEMVGYHQEATTKCDMLSLKKSYWMVLFVFSIPISGDFAIANWYGFPTPPLAITAVESGSLQD